MGDNISILHAPDNYDQLIDGWPVGSSVSRDVLDETFSFMHYFATKRAKLEADFPSLKEHLDKSGMLWVSWPKMTAGVATDVNENVVRDIGLAGGLVDVKVAAVDETWSGLKFVWRTKDR